jgi:UDP-glucose 4-epimerase
LTEEVIVTGGAGFIGANVVNYLVNKGFNVHVFDNLSTGNIKNLPLDKIKFYNIDLKDNFHNWPIINASCIYHFAANADVRGGVEDHNIDLNENLLVTKNTCDFSVKNDIKEFIFASSATVYGEPNIFPTPESFISNQTSLYGASKFSCEAFIQAYSNYEYFKSTIFRFVSWIGNGYSHGVIYDFVKKLLNDSSKLEILGDGNQVKSYLDVRDGVEGVMNLSKKNNLNSSVFNLGHFQTMKVTELADIVCEELNLDNVKYEFTGGERGWIGDSPLVHLDTKKAHEYGWQPKISIEDGIRETVKYLLSDESRLFR